MTNQFWNQNCLFIVLERKKAFIPRSFLFDFISLRISGDSSIWNFSRDVKDPQNLNKLSHRRYVKLADLEKAAKWNGTVLPISRLELQSKSTDWFLYDRNFFHERVKTLPNNRSKDLIRENGYWFLSHIPFDHLFCQIVSYNTLSLIIHSPC